MFVGNLALGKRGGVESLGASAVAPVITSSAPTGIAYGVAYSHTYTATGSPAPTWSVTAGALPTGLSLDSGTGVLSGTPTASGAFSWTVTATNTAGTDDQAASATICGFIITTTGAQTLTIAVLNVSAATTVYWGDGNSNTYTGTGARTHNYAGAGTWYLRLSPISVTALDIRDTKIACTTGTIGQFTALTTLFLISVPGIQIAAGEIAALTNLTNLDMRGITSAAIGAAELSGKASMTRYYSNGCTNVAAPTLFPATLTSLDFYRSLSQAQVDALLASLYAAFATRTATGGTINVGGTNVAPSGTLQAACPPTTGKEYAYELVNDSCAVNPTKKWATVTITA